MSKPVVADKAYAYLLLSHGFNPSTGEASNLKSNTQGSHKFEATRKFEIARRTKRAEDIELEMKQKVERANDKVNQKRDEDQDRVAKLCEYAQLPPSEDNVAKCEMENFAKLLAPQLKAFILSRHPSTTPAITFSKLKKPRTALVDANRGIKNLV
mmetsp:Transcript_20379/g.33260  ORF Transcript_20379/g.33260 Transcript_20379/m.33260 type:complete len:155 (-) Transcript_20379:121-585(-)